MPLLLGAAMLGLEILAGGVVLVSVWQGSGLIAYMPDWLLLLEGQTASGAAQDAAIKELADRYENDRLTASLGATLVQNALSAQASTRPWRTGWADIIESARAKGQLTQEQCAQYFRNIVSPVPVVRAKVRVGDRVPIGLKFPFSRLGTGTNFLLYADLDVARIGEDERLDTGRDVMSGEMDNMVFLSGAWTAGDGMAVRQLRRHRSPPGDYTLKTRWHLRVMPPNASGMSYFPGSRPKKDPSALAEWDLECESPLKITPADQDTLEMLSDPKVAEQVRAAAQVGVQGMRYTGQEMRVLVPNVYFKDPPVDLAYTVTVRQGNHEWPGHSMTTSKTVGTFGWVNEPVSGLNEDEPVDVLVKPDPDAARDTIDLFRIFDGELVFSGVNIKWQDVNTGVTASGALASPTETDDDEPFVPEPAAPSPVFPERWAELDETTHDSSSIDARTSELADLIAKDSVPPPDRATLLELALAVQADISRPWHPGWGDIVEEAWRRGQLTPEQKRSYARRALAPTLAVRSPVRVGDDLPAIIRVQTRAGSKGLLSYNMSRLRTTFGPQAFTDGTTSMSGGLKLDDRSPLTGLAVLRVTNVRAGSHGMAMQTGSPVRAPAGKHTFRTRWSVTVFEGEWDPQSGPTSTPDPASSAAAWTLDLAQDVEVLAEGSDVIERVKDDAMADAIRKCIKVRACEGIRSGHEVRVWYTLEPTPMDVAFDVFARSGDQEWPSPNGATSETLDPWQAAGYVSVRGVPSEVQRVDLVFRTSANAAMSTVKIRRVWDGEIVVPGVRVRWRQSDR
jgi:hypothetical protein